MTVALATMTNKGREEVQPLLDSVSGLVDSATILYTGNSGVSSWSTTSGFPVSVFEHPFTTFYETRSELMRRAHGTADWLLVVDDDERVQFSESIGAVKNSIAGARSALALLIPVQIEQILFRHWRLFRGDRLWKYQGVVHEYVDIPEPQNRSVDGLRLIHNFQENRSNKLARYEPMLRADLKQNPNDFRRVFNLATQLRGTDQLEEALNLFDRCLQLNPTRDVAFSCCFEIAQLSQDAQMMANVYNEWPERAEPAHWLKLYYEADGDFVAAQNWEVIRKKLPVPVKAGFVNLRCYGDQS
jgi:tetratricopeptide (TPR) repeat protein